MTYPEVGCNFLSDGELNEREKSARTCCPDVRSESKRIQIRKMDGEKDFVLAIRLFYREDKVVEDVSRKGYIRDGDSKRKLSNEEVRELQNDKVQVDLEREKATFAYPHDFYMDLILQFCDGVRKIRQTTGEHSREEFLVHRRLGKLVFCESVIS